MGILAVLAYLRLRRSYPSVIDVAERGVKRFGKLDWRKASLLRWKVERASSSGIRHQAESRRRGQEVHAESSGHLAPVRRTGSCQPEVAAASGA